MDYGKYILKLWPDIDTNGGHQEQPVILHTVCSNKDINVYVGVTRNWCRYLLMTIGCGDKFVDYAKLLFTRKDIDFHRKNTRGQNALDIVIERYDQKMIDWLKSEGFTPSPKK